MFDPIANFRRMAVSAILTTIVICIGCAILANVIVWLARP
jgi:hypothetical protein